MKTPLEREVDYHKESLQRRPVLSDWVLFALLLVLMALCGLLA